ncbi:MAG: alginate export family protein [Thermodesulfovibrionales bacterium]
MKKYLALILGVLFVLGFAASAFAIHAEIPSETQAAVAKGTTQITIGGEIRARGEIQQNTSDFNDDKADHKSYYDERVRLSIKADVTKNTTAFVHLESGDASNKSDVTWGTEAPEAKGVYGFGNGKQSSLYILEAWILHKGSGLLGIPAGFKIGHQPLALGNKLFFDHSKFGDDAIVLFMDPTKELHVGLLTAKFKEADDRMSKDATGYVGLFNYRTKEFGFSGDVTYVDHQNNTGGFPGIAGADVHLWNFALRGDTNIGGLGIKGDVELQTGKIMDTGGPDQKFRGWAALVGLSYKVAPVTLSLDYAYGSGDNNATDNKFSTFVTALSGVQNYTYVYDYRTKTAAGASGTGIANTQYLKGGVSASLAKDLTGDLNLYWLRAVKSPTTGESSKDIGTEIDWLVKYKIDRNLTYWVEGGYLFAGNAFKWIIPTGTKDPDNAYAVRHGISLSF